jgi:hypothetical protein
MEQTSRLSPTRLSNAVFNVKVRFLQLKRGVSDLSNRTPKLPKGNSDDFPVLLAQSVSSLWTNDNLVESGLQFGKVQNLRCAVRRLNGTFVPSDGIFSFWKQIGKASSRAGYTVGRELREGCLIPSLGGGVCQLSNALYELILQAGFEVVERHAHSSIIPGSAAARGQDATVFWNYVDLRFKAPCPIYIEAVLTRNELVVKFLGQTPRPSRPLLRTVDLQMLSNPSSQPRGVPNNCSDCGMHGCFRHSSKQIAANAIGSTGFLLDECWPEFREYVAANHSPRDLLCIPIDGERWGKQPYSWSTTDYSKIVTAGWQTLKRSMITRRLSSYGAQRLHSQLKAAESLARYFADHISPEVEHMCVSQNLLPFLWQDGYLGGRSFDVLMTRLPLFELEERLNATQRLHPERATLAEFRAPAWIVKAEREALNSASKVISPHSEIQSLFPNKAVRLRWHLPKLPAKRKGRKIVFPGPTAARKGAYELRMVLRELDFEITVLGANLEGPDFWNGLKAAKPEQHWSEDAAMVVQPAMLEDKPRILLEAISLGLPVIATEACGLSCFSEVINVASGNEEELRRSILFLAEQ